MSNSEQNETPGQLVQAHLDVLYARSLALREEVTKASAALAAAQQQYDRVESLVKQFEVANRVLV